MIPFFISGSHLATDYSCITNYLQDQGIIQLSHVLCTLWNYINLVILLYCNIFCLHSFFICFFR